MLEGLMSQWQRLRVCVCTSASCTAHAHAAGQFRTNTTTLHLACRSALALPITQPKINHLHLPAKVQQPVLTEETEISQRRSIPWQQQALADRECGVYACH